MLQIPRRIALLLLLPLSSPKPPLFLLPHLISAAAASVAAHLSPPLPFVSSSRLLSQPHFQNPKSLNVASLRVPSPIRYKSSQDSSHSIEKHRLWATHATTI
ncbi:hypothetical protein Droror1_Dr00026688 [Drosera rotundifolia]